MAYRPWAFWRRVQYGAGFSLLWCVVIGVVYVSYFYTSPDCFDNEQNGDERGVDCGGSCVRICAFDVQQPSVIWARSFAATPGLFNLVGYVENRNPTAASPAQPYTFTLYDDDGMITEVSGETILPPNSEYPIFEPRVDTNGRIPTRTFLSLGEAELWQPAEQGREQFVVVSRQLESFDAEPRLFAELSNTALTEARDVEIVATIFDAAGNALTSSRTVIERFLPRSEETVVFTWQEPIAATVRSCEIPTDVMVAIDLSGSMNNDQAEPPEPITSVLTAASAFVDRLQPDDQVGVVTFATEAAVVAPLSNNTANVASLINDLVIDPEEETGSTNTGDAFYRATEELQSMRNSDEARNVLVILTDGLATAPDEEPEAYALTAAAAAKAAGITVYAIGLGADVNMDFIRSIASTPQQAYAALTTADTNRIYQTITASLCEDGPAVIEIIPKTKTNFTPLR